MTDTPPLAIVGGGIAGLALALNLHARGISCRIFEAVPTQRELGVGLTLLPHAVRELGALGLQAKVAAIAMENRSSAFFNRFGQRIFEEPRGRCAGYPFPELGIHRGRLHALLFEEVVARLGAEAIMLDRRLVSLTQGQDGVELYFKTESGSSTVQAAGAIGCDGVNSTVRRIHHPGEDLRYTGINTWRGVTRRKPILDGKTYVRIGSIRTGKIVIYPIAQYAETGEQLINWVAEIQSQDAIPNEWNRTSDRSVVSPLFRDWKFDWLDVEQLVSDAELILEYPMVDKDPIDRWTFGRITLAGDAAHPMYPRGSNGVAQALIDVRTLAGALATHPQHHLAFAHYEAERRDATARIVHANRTIPPDLINIKVEELTGDQPFDDLSSFISQEELRRLSDDYKRVAGFQLADVSA